MRKSTLFLFVTVVTCISLFGCGGGEQRNAKSVQDLSSQQQRAEVSSGAQQDERLQHLAALSFQSAVKEDWGLVFSIVPITASGEPDLGIVRQWQGKWVAGYDSGFASSELVGMEFVDSGTVRFIVDIWRNVNPEEPFAPRQPDPPTYRFYVDLAESQFRELLRSAIIEERRRTGAYLPAMNTSGAPVESDWYDPVSSTAE